ncbi:MAG: tRNA-dihydrouridine synthase family protein [Oscillibacter sp.]
MRIDFAPLEGITTFLFRNTHHALFGGADRYFTPFFSPAGEHIFTTKELRDVTPAHNDKMPVIPQIMTRHAADFLWAAGELAQMGYGQVNLNLGCPSGTVVGKGKGAGFLAHPQELDCFLEEIFSKTPVPVSIKTRLGIADPAEFSKILEIYSKYPLEELIIHPRVQKEFYKGPLHRDVFDAVTCPFPLCYNGDLVTVEDVTAFAQTHPQIDAIMLGRGAVADPALPRKLRGGPAATRAEVQTFTQTLYAGYREIYEQDRPAAQRMKEIWFYLIHLFADGEQYNKQMRRVSHPRQYEMLEAGIFRDLELLPAPVGALI